MTPQADLIAAVEENLLAHVFRHVVHCSFGTDTFLSFDMISDLTGLNRDYVRAACRALTDRGLMAYSRSLWTDDGECAGAGYGITPAGVAYLRDQWETEKLATQPAMLKA